MSELDKLVIEMQVRAKDRITLPISFFLSFLISLLSALASLWQMYFLP